MDRDDVVLFLALSLIIGGMLSTLPLWMEFFTPIIDVMRAAIMGAK